MPLTQLETKPALVIIDMQKGVLALPGLQGIEELKHGVVALARGFRERGFPVVLVNVAGVAPGRTEAKFSFTPPPDFAEIIPELEQQPSDFLVTKHHLGAFGRTNLHEVLQKQGVTQIVLAGVSTTVGVESTARAAYDLGYHVVLVTDAMMDRNPAAHQHAMETIFPRLGELTDTSEVIRALQAK